MRRASVFGVILLKNVDRSFLGLAAATSLLPDPWALPRDELLQETGQKESDLKATPHNHHSELRVCELVESVSTEQACSFQAT